MPRAFTQNYYHLVFSTKDREELIFPDWEARLYAFSGGIARDLRCSLLAMNGMPDHVHMLLRFPSDIAVSDMVREIKSRSSKWIHGTFPKMQHFAWQEGYGGFTVNTSIVKSVSDYIAGQKTHHAGQDFKTEFLELLRRHGVEFSEEEVFM